MIPPRGARRFDVLGFSILVACELYREERGILDRTQVELKRIVDDSADDPRPPEHRRYRIRRFLRMRHAQRNRSQFFDRHRARSHLRSSINRFNPVLRTQALEQYLTRAWRD